MQAFFHKIAEMLPGNSIFLSDRPWYEISLPFVLAILTAFIMLHLAWASIGSKVSLRRSIWPAVILGLAMSLARQMLPSPYQQIIGLVIMIFVVQIFSKIKIIHAVTATLFVQAVIILGGILIGGPILLALKPASMSLSEFTATPMSLSLGAIIETLLPALVLWLFTKYKLTLIGRSQSSAGNTE